MYLGVHYTLCTYFDVFDSNYDITYYRVYYAALC